MLWWNSWSNTDPHGWPIRAGSFLNQIGSTNWEKLIQSHYKQWSDHFDGLAQDCGDSSALAMELLHSCTKASISGIGPWSSTIMTMILIMHINVHEKPSFHQTLLMIFAKCLMICSQLSDILSDHQKNFSLILKLKSLMIFKKNIKMSDDW